MGGKDAPWRMVTKIYTKNHTLDSPHILSVKYLERENITRIR